ncbi:hypothetical protein [Alienimonas chondri]|uniref:hypothetical protein n=1 Tax=Alienimonas chondri TaxID=2681879 RepID=UPI0019D51393|nr:hypothetical protein [Alienimonas chondri]
MLSILLLAAAVLVPITWGAIVLRFFDRWFTHRDPEKQIPYGEAFVGGMMLCLATFAAAGLVVLGGLATDSADISLWGGSVWLLWIGAFATVHASTTVVAWAALERGTSRGRAWAASAGAATVWLGGMFIALAAWGWVLATFA